MKFYFCEKCGKRILDRDIAAGEARDKKLRGMFCGDCAAGVMTMESVAITDEQAQELVAQEEAKAPTGVVPALRRTSKQMPVSPSARGSSQSSMTPARRGARGATPAQGPLRGPASARPMPVAAYAALGGGVLLVLVGAFLIFGGKSKAPVEVAKRPSSTKTPEPITQSQPAPQVAPSRQPVLPAQVPAAEVAEAKPRELTPKELYEQKVKAGLIKPPEPQSAEVQPAAQTVAAQPSAPGVPMGAAQPLWNETNLSDWRTAGGRWSVSDAQLLVKSDGPGKTARIETVASFGAYDWTGQVRLDGPGTVSLVPRVGSMRAVLPLNTGAWSVFRVTCVQGDPVLTLDGKTIPWGHLDRSVKEGVLALELAGEGEARFKDLRIAFPAANGEWISLFDGQSLAQWTEAKGRFEIRDGAIVGDATKPEQTSVRLDSKALFDSGEVEYKFRQTGHRYNELNLVNPDDSDWVSYDMSADVGIWHQVRLVLGGERPVVELNGKVMPVPKVLTAKSYRIAFWKGNNSTIELKDLRYRPLAPATPPEKAKLNAEWTSLFDGATLAGWQGRKGEWKVLDGALTADAGTSPEGSARIDSAATYENFELEGQMLHTGHPVIEVRLIGLGNPDARHLFKPKPAFDKWLPFVFRYKDGQPELTVNGQSQTLVERTGGEGALVISFLKPNEGHLRLKGLRIRTLADGAPAPAPAPATAQEAGTSDWKALFNGQDLTGWNTTHGEWRVVAGALAATGAQRNRIESTEGYGDFELVAQVRMPPGTRHIEIQVREYGRVFEIKNSGQPGEWREVRILARGDEVTCTVGGAKADQTPDSATANRTGKIALYGSPGQKPEWKDLKIRVLK
ncbi:MAG: DUF1080 domain-containing protein [Planctomycetes bacterium]|nr:DUF1080 domain-containing protein [Planctomycetota bacterium]